jgi:1-acyl-sn-glycerol-3-phosphate acyltransferase
MEQRTPIVPVHIDRTHELLPKGRRLVRPGVVKVRFGPPIRPPEDNAVTDHYAALQALTRRVQAAVEALAREMPAHEGRA